jgi:predicted  nucleic acid-binding Zn-ribbon protein
MSDNANRIAEYQAAAQELTLAVEQAQWVKIDLATAADHITARLGMEPASEERIPAVSLVSSAWPKVEEIQALTRRLGAAANRAQQAWDELHDLQRRYFRSPAEILRPKS